MPLGSFFSAAAAAVRPRRKRGGSKGERGAEKQKEPSPWPRPPSPPPFSPPPNTTRKHACQGQSQTPATPQRDNRAPSQRRAASRETPKGATPPPPPSAAAPRSFRGARAPGAPRRTDAAYLRAIFRPWSLDARETGGPRSRDRAKSPGGAGAPPPLFERGGVGRRLPVSLFYLSERAGSPRREPRRCPATLASSTSLDPLTRRSVQEPRSIDHTPAAKSSKTHPLSSSLFLPP